MAEQKTKTTTVKVLRVVSKSPKGRFFRAGIEFGAQPRDVRVADLKREQLKAIKEEPMLLVLETEIEVPVEEKAQD
jgi:hypothetical protein